MYVAPGNAGTQCYATNVPIKPTDTRALLAFATEHQIGLTIVGPELPLVTGIVDEFRGAGLNIFGPTGNAAQLEGSKWFAKQLMQKMRVPTAAYRVFTEYAEAWEYVSRQEFPLVIKADGLAAGKGAVVCQDVQQAIAVLEDMMVEKKYGEAGATVVIEECLCGQEMSVLALCDGKNFKLLLPSQDHKAVGRGDTGPNTGGMGAIAPVPWVTGEMTDRISREIFQPILAGMESSGMPFSGCLYAGLMMTADGPKVLEFNVRFGDPETQAILPLLKSDLTQLLLACTNGTLAECSLEWKPMSAACIVLASGGYPGEYRTGYDIRGINDAKDCLPGVIIYHAGTARGTESGLYETAGGRVINVTHVAPQLEDAIAGAYKAAGTIHFTGKYVRPDIGAKALPKVSI